MINYTNHTTAQAAALLGKSQRTIQYWLLNNNTKFPNAFRLDPEGYNSPWIIPASDIEAEQERLIEREAADGSYSQR